MFKSRYYLPAPYIKESQKIEDGLKTFTCDSEHDIYDDALIMPLRIVGDNSSKLDVRIIGGVCDQKFRFLQGYEGFYLVSYSSVYKVNDDEIDHLDETVIFGGDLNDHFGHFIQDTMARLWYLVKHKDEQRRVAFLINPHWLGWDEVDWLNSYHVEMLELLGIKRERILLIENPTQFRRVIVPRQSVYWYEKYNPELLPLVYDTIRDSVTPKKDKKLYLSRSQLKVGVHNESFFENYFSEQGFKVLHTEQLPIKDQIAYIAGADEIACTYGTLSHLALFAKDSTKLINLLRYPSPAGIQQIIVDRMRKLDSVYVDVSLNFMPVVHTAHLPHLIGPGSFWQDFLEREYNITDKTDIYEYLNSSDIKLGDFLRTYMEHMPHPYHYANVYGFRFHHIRFLRTLFTALEPDRYPDEKTIMLQNFNELFRSKLYRFTNSWGEDNAVINLLSDGRIYRVDSERPLEARYWTYLRGSLYFLDAINKPIVEFVVMDEGPRRERMGYDGVLLSEVTKTCNIKIIRPRRKRTYIIRQLIKLLTDRKRYKKLKNTPDSFFFDSKNGLIRFLSGLYTRKRSTVVFFWRKEFLDYFASHDVLRLLTGLKQGLDDISCMYLDHFMLLSESWYKTSIPGSLWTEYDHKKRKGYWKFEQDFEQPFDEDIITVNPYFFFDLYGLKELPGDMLASLDGKTIIDVGGMNGNTALMFNRHFPNSEIHVYEPMKHFVKAIHRILKEDNCNGKITVFNKGLSDEAKREIISYANAQFMSDITTLDAEYQDVKGSIGIIKINTEWNEGKVIDGARSTIAREKPIIAVAIYHNPQDFFGLREKLKEINPSYRFMIRRSELALPQTGLVLIAY